MDAMEAIFTRRSIRGYTPQSVPDELINELLKAAMSAPSAGNQQPWHLVVIDDRKILDEIPTFHPYAEMIREAPLAILVCGDLELESQKGFWVQDCSAATQNILIAAHAKGLGAVWLAMHPREERCAAMKKLLDMPDHVVPLALVSIGYPKEVRPPVNRYNPSRVHRNRW